jgi:tripartite-type tricarboxylate transporter receptor subunit TctC
MQNRRSFIASAVAAAAFSRPAWAQAGWPTGKPIEVIVPYPPGGGIDFMARFVTRYLGENLKGATFVVNNKAGAGGQIGMETIFAAKPDGYTFGAVSTLILSSIPLERAVRYRPEEFTFLANVVDDPGALWVKADSPLKSLADLQKRAAHKPDTVSVGTAAGTGSDDHQLLLAFEEAANVRCLHAPYNGTAQAIRDLLGGSLEVASYNVSEGLNFMRDGRTRCLGLAGSRRWSPMPDVPTFREQGFDVLTGSARGFVAPPKLPAEITASLTGAFRELLGKPEFLTEAEELNLPVNAVIGEDYRAFALREAETVKALYAKRPWKSQ